MKRFLPSLRDGLFRSLVLATLIIVAVAFSNYQSQDSEQQNNSAKYGTPESKSEAPKPVWKSVTEDPTALVTLWLFGATCVLAIVTGGLWWSTGGLVESAENTAERQLRAYIAPDVVAIKYSRTTPVITISFKNCGMTPAYDVIHWSSTATAIFPLLEEPEGPSTPPEESAGHLGPGMSFHCDVSPDPPITIGEISDLDQGKIALYHYGVVIYRDIFEKRRFIKYCFLKGGRHGPYTDGAMAVYNKWNEAD